MISPEWSGTSDVRQSAPPLLPVFRSRLVGDLLALILAHPDRSWTLEGLPDRVQTPYQTVTAEVRRLEQADLVSTRSVGPSKLVTANMTTPTSGRWPSWCSCRSGPC